MKFLKFFQGKVNEPVPEAERLAEYRRRGDVALLGGLYEPYMDMVFGVCFKYLRDEEECKDAVMQIFEKLVLDLRQHEVSNFKSWLHSVARNHCLMKLRMARATAGQEEADEQAQELEVEADIGDDAFMLNGQLDALDECLQKLTNEQRLSIELFYLQDKCYRDIAGQTGFDIGRVKSYIQNGKRKLKICIESNGSY
ncbi:RNA polymerase sigma-70 factor (ECF subfamily) [Dyadobacter sp. BE34]|uniref:RNA polymerase sigma-70 factor (ECF subfamily) n=1 Tax=Dyadobacter fermentans TaxID=94254 RepID=A0ABU1QY95_9BACT|nr:MULTISPECIES: sigma-70 family RNA polymerase sigma factor [Dyadobacter]MDR6806134.1 RNA polymerase sigma-70 factor (ECF subfamily) [Dyadobacter fermentans]MDR7043875.1 RNA polymerase sigma-70 factor (ECF subfamily) [Dyadobacter sp. BE242]MDR7198186.1 RNA polymerase sigma-70 factor (ECF subfamily) [Dyadobacter sp. BE34]MDR7216149.1 RNA polymerase sigma-70 factor (ECF subfamily) [Dyadobacter sp. BE31]MDR7264325.1 RNA polymerase sigma-70 factor (ECF subfamily) [Dyadobacter sp. BE32]